jgi:Helix-turn-helix domain
MPITELSSATIHLFPTNGYISVHNARDGWLRAMVTIPDMPANAYRTIIDLYLSFNCTHGQCNPKYETIANRLGLSKRTVERMVKLIEEHDGIKPPPYTGVPRDFVLTIPSSEVATTAVAGSSDNSCRRSKPRKPTKVATARVAGVATNIDHSSDNCCRTEHWNTEGTLKGGAFSAPRTEYVDRDGDLSKENPELVPAV